MIPAVGEKDERHDLPVIKRKSINEIAGFYF